MIFANGKALVLGAVLTIALSPGILAKSDNTNDTKLWIESARRLQANEFMELCGDVFMSPDHMQQQSYLMSDFADEISNLCLKIAPNSDQGTCQKNDFGNLDSSLQNAFFRNAGQHMGNKKMPIDMMMEWGDAGYVVSDKSAIEQNVMRNDLCVEVHESIGDDFIKQIPVSNSPEQQAIPEEVPVLAPVRAPVPAPVSVKTEDESNNDFTVVHIEKEEDEILSISGIIAITCSVLAVITLFFYFEARRRNRARINQMSHFNNGHKGYEDGVIKVDTGSSSAPVEEIKVAINNADWDSVYKLASRIAENDDGLSPSYGSFKGKKRSHLGAEDQERTKTLDDLAANGDWTGLAVTAALYAGETSGSSSTYSSGQFSPRRNTVNASKNADVEVGQRSMEKMVSSLSRALNAGNWSQVTKYANRIKEEKNSGSSFDADAPILLTSPSSSSISSSDTPNAEMSKKQTIAKLMRAGKWKGVSIMANMYEMESKQGRPYSPSRPYPTSPNHPYSDTRSIIRTKELRHSDRVQENIVGFRPDP